MLCARVDDNYIPAFTPGIGLRPDDVISSARLEINAELFSQVIVDIDLPMETTAGKDLLAVL